MYCKKNTTCKQSFCEVNRILSYLSYSVSFKIQIQIERKLPRVTLVYTFDLHCVAKLPENKKNVNFD